MTQRMCKTCGNWHDLDVPWPCHRASKSSAPYVISDTMAPTKHMGTGEVLDSKAKFRSATRASGCVEIGNETIKPRIPEKLDGGQRREAIRKAIYDLRNHR
ncbi:MAG TPA: hypothetical protein VHN11_07830 [Xanthobacteraceae bacterium]|nr:hypothetical protein [Xanthobacteraceae bacterium]